MPNYTGILVVDIFLFILASLIGGAIGGWIIVRLFLK
jgi:hypothetical protein